MNAREYYAETPRKQRDAKRRRRRVVSAIKRFIGTRSIASLVSCVLVFSVLQTVIFAYFFFCLESDDRLAGFTSNARNMIIKHGGRVHEAMNEFSFYRAKQREREEEEDDDLFDDDVGTDEGTTRAVDRGIQGRIKLNEFGYVYWHRDTGEGVVNWQSSLAEVMRFARAHRRTLISPCVRNGKLRPCVFDVNDESNLRTSACRTKRVGCLFPKERSERDLEMEEDLTSSVYKPMTLSQYYDERRLKSYVDDLVSYSAFANEFFSKIDVKDDEGDLIINDDDGDDKKKKKKKEKLKKDIKKKRQMKKYRAYRMDCAGDHCVRKGETMCKPPDDEKQMLEKWRENFDSSWLEYMAEEEDSTHPINGPRKAMVDQRKNDWSDDFDEGKYDRDGKSSNDDEKSSEEDIKRKKQATALLGRADIEEFVQNGGVMRKHKDDNENRDDEKKKKKTVKNPLLQKTEESEGENDNDKDFKISMLTDSETVGTDVIICDEKNRFVTKIAMISYFHDKTVSSRPLTVTRRGLIRALNSTRIAPREGEKLELRRIELAKREDIFIRKEHPDAWQLTDDDFIKGFENCELEYCHAIVPDEPNEGISLSMKTLKNALKMRYLSKENRENPLVNWKISVNAAWYDLTNDEARLMFALERWSRYIENIAIDFFGSRNLAHPYKAFHWKSKGYLDWRSADLEQDGVFELETRELEQKSMWCASEFVKSVRMEGVDAKARIALVSDIPANADGGELNTRHLVKRLTSSREPGDVDHRVMHMLWDLLTKSSSSSTTTDAESEPKTKGVIKLDVSNPYSIWANTSDSGIVSIIDHIIAEKAATFITCIDDLAECSNCMNVDSEFTESILVKRLLDRTPKARNTFLKWSP
jgi:hypothetical protein